MYAFVRDKLSIRPIPTLLFDVVHPKQQIFAGNHSFSLEKNPMNAFERETN